ncbi:MAG: recombinase family protein [Pseudomonadota bacterium]
MIERFHQAPVGATASNATIPSRTLKDLLSIMEKINGAGAGFRSLTEAIDTTTPAGRMMMQMVGVFAEFEREMIRERTRAGLERARKKGRHTGRRPKLSDDQRQEIRDLVLSGKRTEAEAARLFGVHRSTISRFMREASCHLALNCKIAAVS